jgi:protein-S-isoprenylcysteine O-methyltransferase Ste14
VNSLTARAIAGLVKLLVILGLCLFLPAGSLRFWQAWLFVAVFGGASLLTTVYFLRKDPDLIERRLQIGPTAENRPIQKVIVAFIRPLFLLLLLIPGLDHRFGWSRVPTWLVIAADFALLLGYVIIFFVFKANSFTAGVVTVAPTQRVISTGPYAVVRHPMYSGGLLVMLTTPIALSSWWGLPVTLAMLVGLVLRLQDEEKLLREQLPGYEEYYHRVRYRLIPGIW